MTEHVDALARILPTGFEALLRIDGTENFVVVADPYDCPRMPARLFQWTKPNAPWAGQTFPLPLGPHATDPGSKSWEQVAELGIITAEECDALVCSGLRVIMHDGQSWVVGATHARLYPVGEDVEDWNDDAPAPYRGRP